jgi:hypothetical protein
MAKGTKWTALSSSFATSSIFLVQTKTIVDFIFDLAITYEIWLLGQHQ